RFGVGRVVELAGHRIGDVTAVVAAGTSHAGGDGVVEPARQVEAGLGAAVVAGQQLDRVAAVVERILGGQLDRAAGGVLAVQRALRAAQHFHLGDVEQGEQRAVDARVVDVVDVHAHAGVEGLQRV